MYYNWIFLNTSGLKYDQFLWLILHLYLIIQQDLFIYLLDWLNSVFSINMVTRLITLSLTVYVIYCSNRIKINFNVWKIRPYYI